MFSFLLFEIFLIFTIRVPGERGRYQWGGGIQDPTSGTIYGVPSDSPNILRIDGITREVIGLLFIHAYVYLPKLFVLVF